jgi:hypothetical protein
MMILNEEILKLAPAVAEGVVHELLGNAVIETSDQYACDPSYAGVTDLSPASLFNGATSFPASGIDATALKRDLRLLITAVTGQGYELQAPHFIADRETATRLALLGDILTAGVTVNGGVLAGVPLITSRAVKRSGNSPDSGFLGLLDASRVAIVDDGSGFIDVSSQATIQLDDAPDSPPTAATPAVSLWQSGARGFRIIRGQNYAIESGASAYISGVSYGS